MKEQRRPICGCVLLTVLTTLSLSSVGCISRNATDQEMLGTQIKTELQDFNKTKDQIDAGLSGIVDTGAKVAGEIATQTTDVGRIFSISNEKLRWQKKPTYFEVLYAGSGQCDSFRSNISVLAGLPMMP